MCLVGSVCVCACRLWLLVLPDGLHNLHERFILAAGFVFKITTRAWHVCLYDSTILRGRVVIWCVESYVVFVRFVRSFFKNKNPLLIILSRFLRVCLRELCTTYERVLILPCIGVLLFCFYALFVSEMTGIFVWNYSRLFFYLLPLFIILCTYFLLAKLPGIILKIIPG